MRSPVIRLSDSASRALREATVEAGGEPCGSGSVITRAALAAIERQMRHLRKLNWAGRRATLQPSFR